MVSLTLSGKGGTMKILIVDDDENQAELAKERMQQEGFSVDCALSAKECLKKVSTTIYDAIVSDYSMPRMSGLELLDELAKRGVDTPVIIATGFGDEKIVVQTMKMGAYDYVVKEPDLGHLDLLPLVIKDAHSKYLLKKENARLMVEVVEKSNQLKEMNLKLAELSITDELTGIHNYRFFQLMLGKEWERAQRYNRALSCILIDIDDFKRVNDLCGHPIGDKVLQEIAKITSRSVRQSDSLARYGGEEFVILLPDTNLQNSLQVAEKLRKLIEDHTFQPAEEPLKLTISLGVASNEMPETSSAGALVKLADKALYKAKKEGKNCFRFISSENSSA